MSSERSIACLSVGLLSRLSRSLVRMFLCLSERFSVCLCERLSLSLRLCDLGCHRSRVVKFTATRLRGPGFKPRPGQKIENENFCFKRTPAVVKACHPRRVRLIIKTPLYNIKPDFLSYVQGYNIPGCFSSVFHKT